jgi:TRAP-type C4-dicarboxylate transport system substrate-binding protein
MPSDMWVAVARAMGAEGIKIGMNELITAKKTGLIDAAENNIPTFYTYKQFEVFNYYSHTEHAMVPEIIAFSKNRWDSMSQDDQTLLAQAATDSVSKMRDYWSESEKSALQNCLAKGVTFVTDVDKDSFRRAMTPLYDSLVTTQEQKQILKLIQSL